MNSQVFVFVPVCPEVDSGLGVPREPIRLVRLDDGTIGAVGVNDPRLDVTVTLSDFSHSRMPDLAAIRGYIVKSKSPNCGMRQVPIYPVSAHEGPATLACRSFQTEIPCFRNDSGVISSYLVESQPGQP